MIAIASASHTEGEEFEPGEQNQNLLLIVYTVLSLENFIKKYLRGVEQRTMLKNTAEQSICPNYIHEFPSAITKRDLTFDICLVEQVVWYPALVLGVGTKQPFSTLSNRARKCFGMRILV